MTQLVFGEHPKSGGHAKPKCTNDNQTITVDTTDCAP